MIIVIKSKNDLAPAREELAKALEGKGGEFIPVNDLKEEGFLKSFNDAQIHAAAEQLGYEVQL